MVIMYEAVNVHGRNRLPDDASIGMMEWEEVSMKQNAVLPKVIVCKMRLYR